MKRILVLEVLAAVLSLAACGVATAQGSHAAKPAKAAPHTGHASALPAGKFLPLISAKQAAARHLVAQRWSLVRVEPGGRIADIQYSFGDCQTWPVGVTVTRTSTTVTLSLLSHRAPGGACPAILLVGTARVRIPELGGRSLAHASMPR